MDLDGDGIRDIISGGYPGELYLFRGNGDGTFRAREELINRYGETINVGNSSVPFACDWDRDGDLDLLVGTIEGHVYLIPNASDDVYFKYGNAERLMVGGVPVEAGSGDAGPCVADWDGDGNYDLLLGCGNGSVLFYRNATSEGVPVLLEPVELVPKSRFFDGAWEDYDPTGDLGARSKICVVDWNGDGMEDLLMGMFNTTQQERPDITPVEIAERDRAEAQMQDLSNEFNPKIQEVKLKILKGLGVESTDDLTEEQARIYQERYKQEVENIPGYREFSLQWISLYQIYQKYRRVFVEHGWVWVFLRKPAAQRP